MQPWEENLKDQETSPWRLKFALIFGSGRGLRPIAVDFPLDRSSLVAAPAETHEGGSRVVQLRLAGTCPPFPPFALECMDVIAGAAARPSS